MPAKHSIDLRGVKGWLLLLCIHLVIINPAAYVLVLGINFDQFTGVNGFSWDFFFGRRIRGMEAFVMVSTYTDIVMLVFSIFAGIRLWRLKPRSVESVTTYFLVAVVVSLATLGLPYLTGLPNRAADSVFKVVLIAFVRTALIAAIWLTYLSKSKPVKETYSFVSVTVVTP